ncbi:KH domain-containing protein [Candidatus Gracilibacteria bacterium]|nr:KH domain-containing protein [Candidatus Gracilibacteria bacterium]NUJ98762.1 KH domain-containing protein [Candidatus Gracilibacteria bacterium]
MEKELVIKIVEGFFGKLGLNFSQLEVEERDNNLYYIKIKTEDSGIIIGPKGKNLEYIKIILRLLLANMLEKSVNINLEINDYLESKEERLFSMVKSKIEIVIKTGKDLRLPYLSGYERKLVHSFVADINNPKIYTKSEGEGNERFLYICKKDEKITIDIEGSDI